MSEQNRPAIVPGEYSGPYWQALSEGNLEIQVCRECGTKRHYPRPRCPECLSSEYAWERVSRYGVVYSYTIARRAFHPAWQSLVPYALVIAELDDGVRILADVVGDPVERIRIGQRLEVVLEDMPGQSRVPRFRLYDEPISG